MNTVKRFVGGYSAGAGVGCVVAGIVTEDAHLVALGMIIIVLAVNLWEEDK